MDDTVLNLADENDFQLVYMKKIEEINQLKENLSNIENKITSFGREANNKFGQMRKLVDSSAFDRQKFKVNVEHLNLKNKNI